MGNHPNRGRHWRPISTAPRDGTSLLLFEPGRTPGDNVLETGRWKAAAERWVINNNTFWVVEPTHWQPLPKPPTESLPSLSYKGGVDD
jgi:hypothetical protein